MSERALDDLQVELGDLVEQIRQLIQDNVAEKGNTSDDCQRMNMLNRLSSFEQSVNGLQVEDLISSVAGQ